MEPIRDWMKVLHGIDDAPAANANGAHVADSISESGARLPVRTGEGLRVQETHDSEAVAVAAVIRVAPDQAKDGPSRLRGQCPFLRVEHSSENFYLARPQGLLFHLHPSRSRNRIPEDSSL